MRFIDHNPAVRVPFVFGLGQVCKVGSAFGWGCAAWFLVLSLCLQGIGKGNLGAAETNQGSLLANPQLFGDLLRTNPGRVEANIKEVEAKNAQALANGRATIPFVRQFTSVFTNSTDLISYYTGQLGPQTWVSKGAAYDRYLVRMHMAIRIDQTGTNITSYDPPQFDLREVKGIRNLPNGGVYVDFATKTFRRFGPVEWQKLVDAKGDLSVLGIQVTTTNPVPKFQESWKSF